MVIKREVNGETLEFELTNTELYAAYCEQEHIFDRGSVLDFIAGYEDEDLVEEFGADRTDLEDNLDAIAYEMRRQMNKYDVDWEYACSEALTEWNTL